jgi:hypothetical protein
MVIGAALRGMGGDSSSLDAMIAKKQQVANYQRAVEAQNIQMRNQFELDKHNNLIDALEADLRGKEFDYDVAQAVLDASLSDQLSQEDAVGLLRYAPTMYGSPAAMLSTPNGLKLAKAAYGTDDREVLFKNLSEGAFSPDVETPARATDQSRQAAMEVLAQLQDGTMFEMVEVPIDPDDPDSQVTTKEMVVPMTDDVWQDVLDQAYLIRSGLPAGSEARQFFDRAIERAIQRRQSGEVGKPEGAGPQAPPDMTDWEIGQFLDEAGLSDYFDADGTGSEMPFGKSVQRAAGFVDDRAFMAMYPRDLEFNPFAGPSGRQIEEINERRAQILRDNPGKYGQ